MQKYKLSRVIKTDNSGELRDGGIEGEVLHLPRIGDRFVITAGIRIVSTSPVVDVTGDTFSTLSGSVYKLEKIAEN